jgi:hypothetical protein
MFHDLPQKMPQQDRLGRGGQDARTLVNSPRFAFAKVDGQEGQEHLPARDDERHSLTHQAIAHMGLDPRQHQGDFPLDGGAQQVHVSRTLGRCGVILFILGHRQDEAAPEQGCPE